MFSIFGLWNGWQQHAKCGFTCGDNFNFVAKKIGFNHCIISVLGRCYNYIYCKSWHLPISTYCINLVTKSLHPSLSSYPHYSYPNNMAKNMTMGLQNSTHVSKKKGLTQNLLQSLKLKTKHIHTNLVHLLSSHYPSSQM